MAPADPPPAESIIDPVMLAELRAMRDILPELIEVFQSEVRVRLDAMHQAVETADSAQLMQLAHGIRGAAGNMGGRDMAAACARLEQLGRDGTVEGAAALLPEVEARFVQLCEALEIERGRGDE